MSLPSWTEVCLKKPTLSYARKNRRQLGGKLISRLYPSRNCVRFWIGNGWGNSPPREQKNAELYASSADGDAIDVAVPMFR